MSVSASRKDTPAFEDAPFDIEMRTTTCGEQRFEGLWQLSAHDSDLYYEMRSLKTRESNIKDICHSDGKIK